MSHQTVESALKPKFISHGTLECKDIDATRKFYEEFLGLEVTRTSPGSMMIRCGGQNVIAVVQNNMKTDEEMHSFFNHNGLDVTTDDEVRAAYDIVLRDAEKWGLHRVTKPEEQHGSFSFYFWDMDNNCWEILANPEGGYSWLFDQGDQSGLGHRDKNFRKTKGYQA